MKHCGINFSEWLHRYEDTETAVPETVEFVRNHPLVPADITVRGYII